MKTIGVVTVARSDYSIYRPLLQRIRDDPELRLQLFVGGTHLSPEFGSTAQAIAVDGFRIDERVEMLLSSDTPEGIAKSMGLGTIGFAQAYARSRPDILLVLGDRFEMHAAVVAAVPFGMPVAHIHGGELTEGAIDNVMRHSITKMSHLHFVSTAAYARRVIQMGEEPWRVIVSGAPALDCLHMIQFLERSELGERYDLDLDSPLLLVTYHPVTLAYEHTEAQVRELLEALERVDATLVFTYPGADTRSRLVTRMIQAFVAEQPRAHLVTSLGTEGYFSMMRCASAMVGNSSSGIIEAPSFELPVVNIGDRQKGRIRGRNVLDVGHSRAEILVGIERAMSSQFRASLSGMPNPYGEGNASETIVDTLKHTGPRDRLILKRFHDVQEWCE